MSLRLWRDRKPNSGVLVRTVPLAGSGFQVVALLFLRLLSLEDCSAAAGSNLLSSETIYRLGTGQRRSTRSFTVIAVSATGHRIVFGSRAFGGGADGTYGTYGSSIDQDYSARSRRLQDRREDCGHSRQPRRRCEEHSVAATVHKA